MKNIQLHYASWDQLTPDFQAFFHFLLGADTARGRFFYELYYLWFNIPHEVAHVLREQYGLADTSRWRDENAETMFAAAYWRQRGESQRLSKLSDMLRAVCAFLPDPVPAGEDRATFFDTRYEKLVRSATSFGRFTFSMALDALETQKPWYQVLRTVVCPEAVEAENPIIGPYSAVNAELPKQIVPDMREYLAPHGIAVPEMKIETEFGYQFEYVTWE